MEFSTGKGPPLFLVHTEPFEDRARKFQLILTRTAPALPPLERYTSHPAGGSQTIVVEDLSEAAANVTTVSWEARVLCSVFSSFYSNFWLIFGFETAISGFATNIF